MTLETLIIAAPGPVVMAILGFFIKKWISSLERSNWERKKENTILSEELKAHKDELSEHNKNAALLTQELRMFKEIMDDQLGSFKEHLKHNDGELENLKGDFNILKNEHEHIEHKWKP